VLECLPSAIAARITAALQIPTIGIGAGAGCDGQVLVTQDLLGLTADYLPRFVKVYADLRTAITEAVTRYRDEVRDGVFPGREQEYK
jgi:3-methyl-2-oxobutanoate hydroxymethyltransferase